MKKKNSIECWVFNDSTKRFLLLNCPKTKDHRAYWQPVAGGIESDEEKREACLREVKEETSIEIDPLYLVKLVDDFGVFEEELELHKTVYIYRTQNALVTISEEHTDFRWVTPSDVKSLLLWDSNKQTFEIVLSYLGIN